MMVEYVPNATEHKKKRRLSHVEFQDYVEKRKETIPTIVEISKEASIQSEVASIALALELEPVLQNSLQSIVREQLPLDSQWLQYPLYIQAIIQKNSFNLQVKTVENTDTVCIVSDDSDVIVPLPITVQHEIWHQIDELYRNKQAAESTDK